MIRKATLVKILNLVILQICSINTEAGVQKWSVKMVFLTVSQNSQKISMSESLIRRVASYWLIKVKLRHRCFV